MIIIYFMLIIGGFNTLLYSQRNVERLVIYSPFLNEETEVKEKTVWINTLRGWAEFGGYFYGDDRSHAWYQKLGTFIEIFRNRGGGSLSLLGNIEFIADPHNDINFNPRAIFWEEAFLYTYRSVNNNYWQLGYYHRCKHDIDNIEVGVQRSLIYGSVHGRFVTHLDPGENVKGVLAFKSDIYTILQDSRRPVETEINLPNVNNLVYTIALNYNIKSDMTDVYGIYFNSSVALDFYSQRQNYFDKWVNPSRISFNGGGEAGIYLRGKGRFMLGLRYERIADTGIEVIPRAGNLISLGVTLQPKEIF
jgi:hypothetical protein